MLFDLVINDNTTDIKTSYDRPYYDCLLDIRFLHSVRLRIKINKYKKNEIYDFHIIIYSKLNNKTEIISNWFCFQVFKKMILQIMLIVILNLP